MAGTQQSPTRKGQIEITTGLLRNLLGLSEQVRIRSALLIPAVTDGVANASGDRVVLELEGPGDLVPGGRIKGTTMSHYCDGVTWVRTQLAGVRQDGQA